MVLMMSDEMPMHSRRAGRVEVTRIGQVKHEAGVYCTQVCKVGLFPFGSVAWVRVMRPSFHLISLTA
jgi:hypothetical protein